jgi:hypothetical protein
MGRVLAASARGREFKSRQRHPYLMVTHVHPIITSPAKFPQAIMVKIVLRNIWKIYVEKLVFVNQIEVGEKGLHRR